MKASRAESPDATPAGGRLLRDGCRGTSPSCSGTPGSALHSPSLKLVFLQDWWLVKSDVGSGMRLGIGGFSSKENNAIRMFASAPVAKRHDAVTLVTVDGIIVTINGHLNRSRTNENGFPPEVYDHFVIGFPYYWEDFATLSFEEKSKGSSPSETCQAPSNQEDTPKIRTPSATASKCKRSKTDGGAQYAQRSGPMTRSRVRMANSSRTPE